MEGQRLRDAYRHIGLAMNDLMDDRERRRRVLVAMRQLISWLGEGVGLDAPPSEVDPDIESSRHG